MGNFIRKTLTSLKIAGRNHLRAMRLMERVAAELQKTEPRLVLDGPDGK